MTLLRRAPSVAALLLAAAPTAGCILVDTGPGTPRGPAGDPSAAEDAVAEAPAFFAGISGLWTGPASRTPLGDFPLLNMDVRDVDGRTLFARTDLDADNSLRFSFEVEDAGDAPALVFRNGGYFQGLLRDSRTSLRARDGDSWRFCAVDRGCDYIDATFALDGDELTLQVDVNGAQHLTWAAHRAEERPLPDGYPEDGTPVAPGDFPPLSSLDVDVGFSALDADADVWVFLSTTPCGTTFSCTAARQNLRGRARRRHGGDGALRSTAPGPLRRERVARQKPRPRDVPAPRRRRRRRAPGPPRRRRRRRVDERVDRVHAVATRLTRAARRAWPPGRRRPRRRRPSRPCPRGARPRGACRRGRRAAAA